MKEYLVCAWAMAYGVSLHKARRFNEEEKLHVAEWYRELGFVNIAECVELEYLGRLDVFNVLGNRKEDGSFQGYGNSAYIITEQEWNQLVCLNNTKKQEKERLAHIEKIKEYEEILISCEKQERLYTQEEAKKKRKKYNDLYNEGGYGFIPHFYTVEEYEFAKEQLCKLKEDNKRLMD